LVQVAPTRLLAVVVLSNGHVVHRFCEFTRHVSPSEVTRAGNALDELLRDVPVSRVGAVSPVVEELPAQEELLRSLIAVIARGVAGEDADLYLEGASHILEQPEFREANKVEPLVRFLEERRSAYETLREMLARRDLTVSIGQENPHVALREVSV